MADIGVGQLDVGTIVDNLMVSEQDKLKRLQTSKSAQQVQISAYGQLSSYLSTFQTQLKSLTAAFDAVGYSASTSIQML